LGGFVLEGLSASPPERTSYARALHAITRAPGHDILIIAGTRPECIKLAPILRELAARRAFGAIVANSGQHVEAVRRTFAEFRIQCDVELPPLPAAPNLGAASRHLVRQLRDVIAQCRPSLVLVQGDTLTAYAGARAGAGANCPVAHVEAGLRAPSASDPFPEEWFRRRIARHAQFHFAPCDSAYLNLIAEGTPKERIHQVGNTGIDSLRSLLALHPVIAPSGDSRQVLVTLHRRENWDSKADIVCDALVVLAEAHPDLRMLVPVHPNPRIAPRLRQRLSAHAQFTLVDPLGYRDFITAVSRAALVISDSGGIQEEVPHLGVPLLVPRSCTERPEGVATGFVRIVPVDRDTIVREALAMLAAPRRTPLPFDRAAPFGDGTAAARIVDVLESALAEAVAA
jgi:UDP-N-acetylglucosamine 2-epimerase (non-hydrolysing)